MSRLDDAVAEAAAKLDRLRIPYMIIGGFAVTVWGEPRLTQDVDVTIECDPKDTASIDALAAAFEPRTEKPHDFVSRTRVLPVRTGEGVAADLVFAGLPFEVEAIRGARQLEIAGYPVRICRPEDLVVMKVISSRPRDREDVRSIVRRQGEHLDRAYLDPIVAELAEALAQPDIQEFYKVCWGELRPQ